MPLEPNLKLVYGLPKSLLNTAVNRAMMEFVDIGQPDTEREIEVSPLEEPVPSTAPLEEPAVEPEKVPA